MASAIDRRDAGYVRRAGIPVLEGTATGLAAFGHLFEYRDHRELLPVSEAPGVQPAVRERWRDRLAAGRPMQEAESLALLADYGVPVVRSEPAANSAEALAAAERIGWPVAIKSAAHGMLHKSDVGGVRLGIAAPQELAAAYEDLAGRLGREVLVQATASPGVELALGVVSDPQFGGLLMIASGGILIEVFWDRRFALPPIDLARAHRLIDRLEVRPLLEGARGRPPADVDAIAAALVRLSVLVTDLGEQIEALDVNPLIAGPSGCVAVDALVIPK